MPCYHPLKGFIKGFKDNGTYDLKITSYETDHVEEDYQGRFTDAPSRDRGVNCKRIISDYLTIPCGQCFGCRLERSRQWADRLSLELKNYDSNYFITLTYDDDHLPSSEIVIKDTGEVIETHSLVKEDYQKFLKRLRKAHGELYPDRKIRYFGCGEYGDHTFRPHYHLIMMNMVIPDLKFKQEKTKGDLSYRYYESEWLDNIWKNGHVMIGAATWETVAYTARYVMKKLTGKRAEEYEHLGIIPEFCTMSRRPGIARDYYEENFDKIWQQDKIYVSTSRGSHGFSPPRYYRYLFDIDCPDESRKLRNINRHYAEVMKKIKLESTSLSYLELLDIEEKRKKRSVKALTREL